MSIKLYSLSAVAMLALSAPLLRASMITINAVSFVGNSANPSITVYGSGFGTSPTATSLAAAGFSGLDYGTLLHITDVSSTPLFDAGYDDPAAGYHDTIGLTDLNYTDTAISFGLGSVYQTYPVKFYAGDTYTIHIADASYSGIVSYQQMAPTPEPSTFILLASGVTLLLSLGYFPIAQRSLQTKQPDAVSLL